MGLPGTTAKQDLKDQTVKNGIPELERIKNSAQSDTQGCWEKDWNVKRLSKPAWKREDKASRMGDGGEIESILFDNAGAVEDTMSSL